MAPNRIIIDTDPGVDDVLAMLLAFSAKPEELEVLMLSVQFGNIDVQSCLRNIVSLFQFIEKERAWRVQNGRPAGFETLEKTKPIVAVGAEEPLAEHMMVADFFHGIDGLGGIHHSHPHLTPAETWKSLFQPTPESMDAEQAASLQAVKDQHSLFTPSTKPAPEEMLRLLRENEPDTITIVAIGPLTNLAVAAATDPETFLRVKEVVVMGGAVDVPGNMTPGAEFNTYADSVAAARVFALTSPNPRTTMPPSIPGGKGQLPAYPETLSKQLKLKLFSLDITTPHLLPQSLVKSYTAPLESSPLVQWASLFLSSTYRKIHSIRPTLDASTLGLEMHDPLTIWYCLTSSDPKWEFKRSEDIRVETSGQWTRGTCIVDRRGKGMKVDSDVQHGLDDEVAGDAGGWLDERKGNRVDRCVGSPGTDVFAGVLLDRVFGGAK
ncbi:nucleoside hydrolase [Aaosphaeria arxii CBS 175.79]|uniref:Nucleoside hydrolase n=1 Tax=Aaosphaeria arxii CBS 175.79 TaxID=1450172 RepID=A0A6A5Y0M0_9PLEO|nr:nucleoside hydrolase [Aaosphaeria arxii CBS 175.79]KAF2018627.1 nucleoside hydrolase [Aaosphaeria arxii CBS 175.79]